MRLPLAAYDTGAGASDPKTNKQTTVGILEENKILKVFKVSAKDDETAVNLIESWKTFGNFDDRAFNNSVHWDITIRIEDLQRLF